MTQMVKNLPANAGDLGSIPGSGKSLEKGMATHSSILAWRIPWTEEPRGLQSIASQRVGHNRATNTLTLFLINVKATRQWDIKTKKSPILANLMD